MLVSGGELLIVSFSQDLYGAAEPADANDNLDVTATSSQSEQGGDEVANIPAALEESTKSKFDGSVPVSSDDGLSMTQKLMMIGGVVVVCALFLRSRTVNSNGGGGFKARSMA